LVVQKEGGDFVLLVELKAHPNIDLDERVGRISALPEVADLGEQAASGT
jgi:hypothetical protein